MSAFVDLEYVMTELTDKEKAALLHQWAAETEIELLEREYSTLERQTQCACWKTWLPCRNGVG
jgi:hypothetical protein